MRYSYKLADGVAAKLVATDSWLTGGGLASLPVDT